MPPPPLSTFFFFNDTATTEIYTLSLHDALPIYACCEVALKSHGWNWHRKRPQSRPTEVLLCRLSGTPRNDCSDGRRSKYRSEEHTSELQSQSNLVCRLLLEKKNYITSQIQSLAT